MKDKRGEDINSNADGRDDLGAKRQGGKAFFGSACKVSRIYCLHHLVWLCGIVRIMRDFTVVEFFSVNEPGNGQVHGCWGPNRE